jgi:putative colanic acid biosynthesis acetyltransferase WcaF
MQSAAQMLVGVLNGRANVLPWLMRRYAFRKLLGPAGRIAAWRALGAAIAEDVLIGPGVAIRAPENVRVGGGTAILGRTWIDAWGAVTIGRNCLINDHVDLLTAQHDLGSPVFAGEIRSIEIGDYVWMPRRIVVLPGSVIGDCAVIGTGSVVSGLIPAQAVAVGNPARRIRDRPAAAFSYVPGRDFHG